MSELFFERGLFATLAAALVVPELTTFLIFVYLTIGLSALLARQIWAFACVPSTPRFRHAVAAVQSADPASLRLFSESCGPAVD
jgi:hypothetical protein